MVNKVIIIGNVGSDPEVRVLDGGAKVASLSVATTDRYTDRQTKTVKEITEWHHVVAWRNTADIVDKYVKKGAQIYVEGRLRTRDYTDRDSIKRYITEIMADTVRILGAQGIPGFMHFYYLPNAICPRRSSLLSHGYI